MGRGGAYVPARVAPQGHIHRSIPHAQCVCFWHGNAATRTFGRAHRRRPYGFVWVDCMWVVDVVWANYARGRLVSFGQITCGWLMPCGWITRGRLALSLRYSARMPLRIPLFLLFISVAFIFSMDSDEGI